MKCLQQRFSTDGILQINNAKISFFLQESTRKIREKSMIYEGIFCCSTQAEAFCIHWQAIKQDWQDYTSFSLKIYAPVLGWSDHKNDNPKVEMI